MKKFRIIYLILIVNIGIISGCVPYKDLEDFNQQIEISNFQNPILISDQPIVFDATLTFFKQSLSGLLIVKKINENHFRFAFTTKIGPRIFDVELINGQFIKVYCMEQLDKKAILSILEQYFNILTAQTQYETTSIKKDNNNLVLRDNALKPNYLVFTFTKEGMNLLKIESFKRKKKKMSALFENYRNNGPQSINISHNKYNITLSLKLIQ